MGTLPTRAFRYCEAVTTASAFGWYLFPPLDFTVQWDGTNVLWTYEGAASWFPLTSAQFPGFADYFDGIAPPEIKGFSPPFLSALPEPGVIQIWTGHVAMTRPGWSLLVRPPANLPRSQSYELFEGIIETDRWFGPLFTNLRLTRTEFPISFVRELPLVQVQPIHRSLYAEDVLGKFSFVCMTLRQDGDTITGTASAASDSFLLYRGVPVSGEHPDVNFTVAAVNTEACCQHMVGLTFSGKQDSTEDIVGHYGTGDIRFQRDDRNVCGTARTVP